MPDPARGRAVSRGHFEAIAMDGADPDHPLTKDEGILWLPGPPSEDRGEGDGQAYGPCTTAPRGRAEAVSLVIEDDASTDFSRGLLPAQGRTRCGDPLPSMMAGVLSIVIGIVNLAALVGLGPRSIPGLVRRGTIVIDPPVNGFGGRTMPAGWFVPDADFWVLATAALALASVGILLSRGRGRPLTSLIGFGLNTLALAAGYLLALTDYSQR